MPIGAGAGGATIFPNGGTVCSLDQSRYHSSTLTISATHRRAKRVFDLPTVVTDGVRYLDTSEHDIYTDGEPNALLPAEVPAFMAKLRELFPQHFGWRTSA